MKNISDYINEDNKKVWISITGYRTLLILFSLIEKPRTVDELVEIAQNDEITKKSVSKDTIRLTINTLKAYGCEISRPSKTNKYKYILIKHPFILTLTPDEVDAMILIRERLSNELTWKKVLILNNLYKKFIFLTKNQKYINKIEDTKPLNDVNLKVLSELSNKNIVGKKVNLTYKSPKYNYEDIDVIPQKMIYENGKLYLWCYSFRYDRTIVLSVERISAINSVEVKDYNLKSDYYEVEYEVFGSALAGFKPAEDEEILENNKKHARVKAKVSNEFWFIQRLLLLGSEFRIISPDFFKEILINKIRLIRKGYIK